MKRLSLLITLPITLLLVVFAISNMQEATLNFWPFGITVIMPLFVVALGCLALGALAGALWMWVPLTRWRLRARAEERRVIELEAALAESRAMLAQFRETPPSPAAGIPSASASSALAQPPG